MFLQILEEFQRLLIQSLMYVVRSNIESLELNMEHMHSFISNQSSRFQPVVSYSFLIASVGIASGRKPCSRVACQIFSMLNIMSPHSCTFQLSNACTIPAMRHALITLLGNQFCHSNIISQFQEISFASLYPLCSVIEYFSLIFFFCLVKAQN